jgi:hypothetical protein
MSTSGFIYKITMEANQRFIRKIQTLAGLYFFYRVIYISGFAISRKMAAGQAVSKGGSGDDWCFHGRDRVIGRNSLSFPESEGSVHQSG